MISLLFAFGCASDGPRSDVGGADTGGDLGATYVCGDWAPWIVGRTLTWRTVGTEWAYTTSRTIERMDADGTVERSYVVDDVYSPGAGEDRGVCDDRGYIMETQTYQTEGYTNEYAYAPGTLYISRPQPLGTTWEDAYSVSWTDTTGSGTYEAGYVYSVVDEELVSVGVGTVLAARVQLWTLDDTLLGERWYAPGFGLVLSVSYDADMATTSTYELETIEDSL